MGGPGNIVVNRHITGIAHILFFYHMPSKLLPQKNGNRLPQKHYHRRIALPPKNTAIFWFYHFRQKSTANSRYGQKSTANSQYRQKIRSSFFVLSGSSGSLSVEPLLCGRERETPRPLPIHLPPHLPTPRSSWSSRTMSGLEGESQCC